MNIDWKRKFFTIWTGQAVSVLTSSILQMALIWHLSIKTESAAVLSMASFAGFLPSALLGLFAGTLVDRWNRKITIICSDLFIAAVSLTLAIYAIFAEVPIWLVIVILFVRSIGTAFHTPAISAITPLIVPEESLTKCSGYTQSLQSVGYLLGTAIAAVLYPIISMSAMVFFDVFGAIVASVAVLLVKIPSPPIKKDKIKLTLFGEMKEGFFELKKHKGIFTLLWVGAAFGFFFMPIGTLFPLMVMGYFDGTTVHASISEIAFSIGMLAGGGLLSAWGGFKNRGYTVILSLLVMGLTVLIGGLLPSDMFFFFAVLCLFMGLSVPFYSGPQISLMQGKIEPQYLGRVFGLYGSVMALSTPLGLILSAAFADKVGIPFWFVIGGVICLFLAAFTFSLKNIRNIEKE